VVAVGRRLADDVTLKPCRRFIASVCRWQALDWSGDARPWSRRSPTAPMTWLLSRFMRVSERLLSHRLRASHALPFSRWQEWRASYRTFAAARFTDNSMRSWPRMCDRAALCLSFHRVRGRQSIPTSALYGLIVHLERLAACITSWAVRQACAGLVRLIESRAASSMQQRSRASRCAIAWRAGQLVSGDACCRLVVSNADAAWSIASCGG